MTCPRCKSLAETTQGWQGIITHCPICGFYGEHPSASQDSVKSQLGTYVEKG